MTILSGEGRECGACGCGWLSPTMDIVPAQHRLVRGKVELHYSVCDHCGSELANAREVLKNKEAMQSFKESVDLEIAGRAKYRERGHT